MERRPAQRRKPAQPYQVVGHLSLDDGDFFMVRFAGRHIPDIWLSRAVLDMTVKSNVVQGQSDSLLARSVTRL